jgi:hypothetical protein
MEDCYVSLASIRQIDSRFTSIAQSSVNMELNGETGAQ